MCQLPGAIEIGGKKMATCKYCGQEVKENQAYCTNCGAEQIRQAEPQAEPVFQQPVYTQPDYGQSQYNYQSAQPQQPVQNNSKGTAALVLGIISLLGNTVCNCLCGCIGGLPTLITSIVGLILGNNAVNEARAQGREDKNASMGKTLCIIALILFFVILVINAVLGAVGAASEYIY